MKTFYYSVIFFLTFVFLSNNSIASNGNLSVQIFSANSFTGAAPGDTIIYSIMCSWEGDGPVNNVQLLNELPQGLTFLSSYPTPNQIGGTLKWTFNTIENGGMQIISLLASVNKDIPLGTVITNSVSVTGDANDSDPEDNQSSCEITIQSTTTPDLWVFKWGLLESIDSGSFFTAEKGIATSFKILYFNSTNVSANDVVVTDSLPAGVEYISANPSPSSISGNMLSWNLQTLDKYGYGEITVNVRPTLNGSFQNAAGILSSSGDRNPSNNSARFYFSVVSVLQPRLLKPSTSYGSEDVIMMGSNPKFEGLAKEGAKVTLYEGDSSGVFGDFSLLNAKPIMSAIADGNRHWEIKPTTLTKDKVYYLYLRAEYDGEYSSPFMNFWQPFRLQIASVIDSSGFDVENFVVQTGDQVIHPGALGGSSSSTPDADIRIVKRFKAPSKILTDHSMWAAHDMKLVITENGQTYEETLPVSDIQPIQSNKSSLSSQPDNPNSNIVYDFIYVHKGFGAGATVEVWCRPNYYDDNGNLVLVGLVFVKCHKILIDPAGYVYDLDVAGTSYEWPEIPPENSLINNATITALVRTGDEKWEKWDAEETGQINPQVTDVSTEDRIKIKGYYAFYVPSGQYQITAAAPGYADYTSPILTVIDAPVFHNVGMRKISNSSTGIIKQDKYSKDKPALFTLEQNYPNPFNPYTTLSFYIPVASNVTLKIYDLQGKEVATLINSEHKAAGKYYYQFDGSSLASGVYFYKLNAGKFSSVKKLMLLK